MRFAACIAIIACMACASDPALDWEPLLQRSSAIEARGISLRLETIALQQRFANSGACREDALIMVDFGQVFGEIVKDHSLWHYIVQKEVSNPTQAQDFIPDAQGYQFQEEYLMAEERILDAHEEFLTTMERIGRKKGCFE